MKPKDERIGLALGIASMMLFWVPPIGLFVGIASVIVASTRLKQQLRFSKAALATGILGVLSFVGFWGAIWMLSQ